MFIGFKKNIKFILLCLTSIIFSLNLLSCSSSNIDSNKVIKLVRITPSEASIPEGISKKFTAVAVYSDNSILDITNLAQWSSSAESVAVISNESGSRGELLSKNQGTSIITASYESFSGTADLTVTAEVLTSMTLSTTTAKTHVNTNKQITATGIFSDGSSYDVTKLVLWSSSNTKIATISNDIGTQGLATGLSSGTTTIVADYVNLAQKGLKSTKITANIDFNVSGSEILSIIVTPGNQKLQLNTTSQYMAIGIFQDGAQDITNSVTWSSSDKSVAVISDLITNKGFVTTLASGVTTISALFKKISGSTLLNVKDAKLISISVTPESITTHINTTQQYTAIGTYDDNTTQDITSLVDWSSSNNLIATISNASYNKGFASVIGGGTANITATYGLISGSSNLVINSSSISSLAVTPTSLTTHLNTTQQYTAIATYSDGSTQDVTNFVTWQSSNNTIATVSNEPSSIGVAKGIGGGTVNIIASYSSLSANSTLIINGSSISSIAVTPTGSTIHLDTNQQYTAIATYSDGSTQDVTNFITWQSSNSQIALISNMSSTKGIAYPIGNGTVNITAIYGSLFQIVTLTVNTSTLSSIAVTPTLRNIYLHNGNQQYAVTGTYSDGSTQNLANYVTWNSSALAATISNSGLASAQLAGTTFISAQFKDTISNNARLNVLLPIVSVSASPISGSQVFNNSFTSPTDNYNLTFTVTNGSLSTPQTCSASITGGSSSPCSGFVGDTSASCFISGVTGSSCNRALSSGTGPSTLTIIPSCTDSVTFAPSTPSLTVSPHQLIVSSNSMTGFASYNGANTCPVGYNPFVRAGATVLANYAYYNKNNQFLFCSNNSGTWSFPMSTTIDSSIAQVWTQMDSNFGVPGIAQCANIAQVGTAGNPQRTDSCAIQYNITGCGGSPTVDCNFAFPIYCYN